MLDMLIQGGRVVTPAGVGDWDVGVVGEKIVSVAFPGSLPAAATQVIDASGKVVVPGGIETHAHAVANIQPGARTLVPGVPNAGPLEHSLGAIWGGTTTVIDFAPVPREGDLAQGIHNYLAPWRGQWDWYNVHLIHSKLVEELAFQQVVRLAARTGAGTYFVHVTAQEGLDAIAEARSRGLPVYGEVLTLALSFTCDRYKEADGM